MSVLFPDPLDPDERRGRAGRRVKRDVLQHRNARVVFERHVVELHLAAHVRQRRQPGVFLILGRHAANLADAIEAGERFADLRADVGQLDHRQRHQRGEREIHDEVADRHLARANRRPADQHHRDQARAEDQRRRGADGGHAGHRLRDVAEQPVRALGEDHLFALLGRVGLDDADAAERFGEPAGHLRVDLAALAEQRPQPLERHRHPAAEGAEDQDRHRGQLPVEIKKDAERERGRHDRSRQLHDAGADEIPDAFGVGHDPRDEDAGLRRVEVPDRQAHHVRLDVLPHFGDGALAGHAEHLRVRERAGRIDERRHADRQPELRQQVPLVPAR